MFEVWPQKIPRGFHLRKGFALADVASPDHLRAMTRQFLRQSDGLRVVQYHDVVGPDDGQDVGRVLLHRALVNAPRLLVHRRAVAILAMQRVMQTFGDSEEVWRAADHEPTRIDAQVAAIAQH